MHLPISRNFDGNELTELVSDTFAGTNIRSVSLSNNRIAMIAPGAFAGIRAFGTINLVGNNLETISEGVFTLSYRNL